MNKTEFLLFLAQKLNTLPQNEIEKSQSFYSEMIDDRIEDGMSEEEAVQALGNIDDIVKEIMLDMPLPTLMKAKMKPINGLKIGEIVAIILGFPIWFSLLIAFFAVIFSVYISIWAVIISLYASVGALVISGMAGCVGSYIFFAQNITSGLFILGCSFFCIGIGILSFFAVMKLSVWLIQLTTSFLRVVKSLFIKKEAK